MGNEGKITERDERLGEVCFRLENQGEAKLRAEGEDGLEPALDAMWNALTESERRRWYEKGARLLRRMKAVGLSLDPIEKLERELREKPDGLQAALGFRADVPAGATITLVAKPEALGRLGRLWVCESVAEHVSVCDIRIGCTSLFTRRAKVPCSLYSTAKSWNCEVSSLLNFDAWPAVDSTSHVTMVVENESSQPLVFKAFFEVFLPH